MNTQGGVVDNSSASLFLGAAGNTTDQDDFSISPFWSYHVYAFFQYLNGYLLSTAMGLFGMVSNAVNMAVFSCMGLSETMNIKVFGLSAIDLVVSLCIVGMNAMYILRDVRLISEILAQELATVALLVVYPTLGCAAMVTAIISTEKCLCIVIPLKVKRILTPRRTWYLISGAAIFALLCSFLMLTITGPPYDRDSLARLLLLACSFSTPSLVCFFIVSISTIFLISRLRQNLTWRKAVFSRQPGDCTVKDLRACRCAVIVCVIFIVCFFPSVLGFVTQLVDPRLSVRDPHYRWMVYSVSTVMFLFQAVTSSINIFIYYSMNSRYRTMFQFLFRRRCGGMRRS